MGGGIWFAFRYGNRMSEELRIADGGVFRVVGGRREWVCDAPVSAWKEWAKAWDGLGGDVEERTGGTTWKS